MRLDHGWGAIDFTKDLELTFEAPDPKAFPALGLAYEAARLGGAAPAWLSAANEVAVAAFLADEIALERDRGRRRTGDGRLRRRSVGLLAGLGRQ